MAAVLPLDSAAGLVGSRRGCAATSSPTSCSTRSSARTRRTPSPGCPVRTRYRECSPALARLQGDGARPRAGAPPAPGDPVGLGGPAGFNAAALEAGEAVVVSGSRSRAGAGPRRSRCGLALPAQPPPAPRRRRGRPRPALAAARRRELAGRARRGPLASRGRGRADEPAAPPPVTAPPGIPAAASTWPAAGCRRLTIVDLALADDGGARHGVPDRRARAHPSPSRRRRPGCSRRGVFARVLATRVNRNR